MNRNARLLDVWQKKKTQVAYGVRWGLLYNKRTYLGGKFKVLQFMYVRIHGVHDTKFKKGQFLWAP